MFLAHLSRRLTRAHQVTLKYTHAPASVHIVQRSSFQNCLANQNQICVESQLLRATKACSPHLGHMTKMASTPIYGKKTFKNLLLRNQWTDFHETWYVALGTWVHHVYLNDDPRLVLTYKVTFCNLCFVLGKVRKTILFQKLLQPVT